ncbi:MULTISPECIES: sporulation integral membrane protein YtvI [Erysipelothrix]|uniref:Sporulation integral membrane protein YtvI n=1 Tax=Erysipelothrix piscisicarius TaxID=2485784 RepID=A0A3Q8S7G4_9FIRM|nr:MULTISPECIES: sporulation integral membrane protein YtvI [Erysipelothrix]AZK44060.1 sporulation integral membrane protein YtvI [Erysipelothrix piscisicarius]MBK2402809.1 sporulation integral membrane protein YtvI [Erysipelothrix sp. strain 2 (EsS2-6-Brazil)]MBK2404100.1 sporulation integral membrane protein YtvI [Erysipelothrix sp. strain 2 (EsS2-7-Brazil)]NBA01697.1 sporulation integral membrane protein YtvI [Erysipelothrix rhusiopathiae]
MIEKRKNFIINILYFAISFSLAALVLKFSTKYLMPFIIGFVIAFLLKPVISKLTKKIGNQKGSSLLVVILFYILLAAAIFWILVAVIAGIQNFAKAVPSFYQTTLSPAIESIIVWVEGAVVNLDPDVIDIIESIGRSVVQSIDGIFKGISGGTINFITRLISSIPSVLISILIAIISSFFFTLDYQGIVNSVMGMIPLKQRTLILDIKDGLISVLGKYLRAYAKLMSLTFVELSIAFFVLGIHNPIGLAFMVAIIDILPVLGTGTVMIPWFIIELIMGNTPLGVGLMITYIIITVIRNILEPKIVGDQIGLHPLATLILIYVGLKMFGFVGLFALPISATILKTLHDEGKITIFRRDEDLNQTAIED